MEYGQRHGSDWTRESPFRCRRWSWLCCQWSPLAGSLISPAHIVRSAYRAQSLGVPYNNSFIYPNVTGYSFSFTEDGYFEQTQCASICQRAEGLA